ncbi:MAG TPA: prephenate dehydratase [Solirubrobacteraceae bacterium]|nr:prephenate dehydratase [Solirubrobacteraceae bacterium]
MRVAYLGPDGTVSHEALMAVPGADDFELVPEPTLHDAIVAVHDGTVDRALVPIENALEGSVNPTLDAIAFETDDVVIVGELRHPVHLCLLAGRPLALDAIETVVSHPQASAQCARFLRTELADAQVVAAPSTADAVRQATIAGDETTAALGTRHAARLYGATVLALDVEDDDANETRFVWIARAGTEPERGARFKTALVFWGAGSAGPGWLVRCLLEFATRGVNLTRIESRPRREGLGEYMFFLDVDGGLEEPPVAGAVEGLRAHADVVRVLGSFPAA